MDWYSGGARSSEKGKFIVGLSKIVLSFAQSEFKLSKRTEGVSLREHLRAVERATRRKPPELSQPHIPPSIYHVWRWFCELSSGRQSTIPISWQEIKAWSELTGKTPNDWELKTIKEIDIAFLNEVNNG